jgi:hypothetical protein
MLAVGERIVKEIRYQRANARAGGSRRATLFERNCWILRENITKMEPVK